MTYISLCAGIEAASAAWIPLGWVPVAFSEIEPFPCRVLKHHHPGVPNHGDFTAFDWSAYRGAVDVLIAGTPCQAFSVAGLRGSLGDARGNLTLEFIRAANAIQPRIIVWENVPGVLSTSDNAFGCFLAGIVGCNEPILAEHGWPNAGVVHGPARAACWRILDAQYFGLAQRRKRLFVVSCPRNGADPAEILFEFESMRRDSPPLRESRQKVTGTLSACANSGGGLGTDFELDGGLVPEIASTLDKGTPGRSPGFGRQYEDQLITGPIMSREGAGLYDPTYQTFVVSPPLTQNPYGDHESMPTMRSKDLDTYVAHTLRGRGFDASEDGTGRGTPLVPVAMAVRRLTPRECERLQGFPDNYTAIPGAADSPRYKAIGNSMAVPVIEWIGRRIMEAAR